MSPVGSPGAMRAIAMWGLVFKTRQYLKGSLWFLPLLGGIAGAALGAFSGSLDRRVEVLSSLEYSASTAEAVLAAIVGSTAALTGFVVTVSVLVVQMATGTFSARYMRLWYRDRMLHVLLAMLVGTFTFSVTLLAGVEENSVPNLGITASGGLMAVDMLLFLFFLDRFVHRLRPVAVAALVADAGRRAFASVVRAATGPDAPDIVRGSFERADEPAVVVRTHRAGSIQAIHAAGLVRFARAHNCTLVLNHVVGDFVPEGASVIRVYGIVPADSRRVERRLRGMIALGVERTSRIRRSLCGSWSTSRSRRCHLRSTTRRPRCRCSTTSATPFARSGQPTSSRAWIVQGVPGGCSSRRGGGRSTSRSE
jgi:uncharacterized membrane protein